MSERYGTILANGQEQNACLLAFNAGQQKIKTSKERI
jgi:hypothetical protein